MTTKQLSRNVSRGLITRTALTIFSAMLLLQLPACVEEQITPPDNEKTISFSLNVPNIYSPSSYALAENDENVIKNIAVLLFEKDENDNGNYISGPHYGSISGSSVTIRIPSEATNYDLEVFANCLSIINDANTSTPFSGRTKTEIFEQLTLECTDKWITDTGDGNYIHIPMHGQVTPTKNEVLLVRMLARINVDAIEAVPTFTLDEIYLYNRNTKGYIANTGGAFVSPPTPNNPLVYTGITGNSFENEIYTFEVETGGVDALTTNPCMIIKGEYLGDNEDYYYRINFVDKDGTLRDITRNHSYNVKITRINGPGYDNITDAFNSMPINIESVVEWNNVNIADAAYDGNDMLGTSTAQFDFNATARGSSNGDNILTIVTNYPDGWTSTIHYTNGASWLSMINDAGDIVSSGDMGTTTLKLQLSENTSGSTRSAEIKLVAGNINYTVSVTQSNFFDPDDFIKFEANTYTMRPNGDKIMIPVSIVNASGFDVAFGSSDRFTAEVDGDFIPVDASMPVKIKTAKAVGIGNSGYVYVETEGNGSSTNSATVRIKDKDDNEIYSWDINVREPDANCYIVRAGNSVLIPISQIRNFERDLFKLTDNSNQPIAGEEDANAWFNENQAFTAALVWADVAGGSANDSQDATFANSIVPTAKVGAGFDDGFVRVDVGAGIKEGNAVVAVLQNGSIRWSWHLWVTNGTPLVSGPNGFMDRNLGSANNTPGDLGSMGLHYQWGRKDPFPTPSAFSNSEAKIAYGTAVLSPPANNEIIKLNTTGITGSTYTPSPRLNTVNNMDYVVANPHTYFFMTTEIYDWYHAGVLNKAEEAEYALQNNNLWGGYVRELSSKTSFDPCPAGWRVPRSSQLGTGNYPAITFALNDNTSPWTGASDATGPFLNLGRTWPTLGGYYPAAGLRSNLSGSFINVGANGYYWSASPFTVSGRRCAGHLYFEPGITVLPANSNGRAGGSSVRCVKE